MKGIIGTVAILIALGLILRFGKTSIGLAGAMKDTSVGIINSLALTQWQGNTP